MEEIKAKKIIELIEKIKLDTNNAQRERARSFLELKVDQIAKELDDELFYVAKNDARELIGVSVALWALDLIDEERHHLNVDYALTCEEVCAEKIRERNEK